MHQLFDKFLPKWVTSGLIILGCWVIFKEFVSGEAIVIRLRPYIAITDPVYKMIVVLVTITIFTWAVWRVVKPSNSQRRKL